MCFPHLDLLKWWIYCNEINIHQPDIWYLVCIPGLRTSWLFLELLLGFVPCHGHCLVDYLPVHLFSCVEPFFSLHQSSALDQIWPFTLKLKSVVFLLDWISAALSQHLTDLLSYQYRHIFNQLLKPLEVCCSLFNLYIFFNPYVWKCIYTYIYAYVYICI